jgi:hypothetical protein
MDPSLITAEKIVSENPSNLILHVRRRLTVIMKFRYM